MTVATRFAEFQRRSGLLRSISHYIQNGHSVPIMARTVAVFRPVRPLFGGDFQGLTGEDMVRVSTDGPLVRVVQRGPSTVEVKGVGDGGESVAGADGVRGVTAGGLGGGFG